MVPDTVARPHRHLTGFPSDNRETYRNVHLSPDCVNIASEPDAVQAVSTLDFAERENMGHDAGADLHGDQCGSVHLPRWVHRPQIRGKISSRRYGRRP